MIDLHEAAIDARKKREELKAKRNRLFEIKTIDDQVADSIERTAKRPT